MKVRLGLLLSVALTLAVACQDDPDVPNLSNDTSIAGNWFCCNGGNPDCPELDPDGIMYTEDGRLVDLQATVWPDDGTMADPRDGYCEAEEFGRYQFDGTRLVLTSSGGREVEYGYRVTGDSASLSANGFVNTCFRLSPDLLSGACP